MDKILNVGIVGCGSAGPATALFLARAGHNVTVFERAPTLDSVGAGFMIQPTGQHVLERLDLLAKIQERGISLRGLKCVNARGRRLMDLHYAEIASDMSAIGLHRAVLLHHLTLAMEREGVALRLGCPVEGVDGSYLQLANNEKEGPFDLLVLADGARSQLRSSLGIRMNAKAYPWGALWHMAPTSQSVDHLYQVVDGAKRMVGMLPTGQSMDESGGPLVSLFWSVHCDRVDAVRTRGIAAWKDEVFRLMPQASEVLETISDFDQLTFARYWDVSMARWHHESTVVIGDAAHATSPQLGQGVNLGLWDAMVLGDSIAEAPTVPEAMRLFQARRKQHLAYYQWATRFLTPFFQSDSRVLGSVRNLGLGIACSIGPLRRQMVYTMAGLKRGLVRQHLALPSPSHDDTSRPS